MGFKITLDIGNQVTNFLDVTISLSDGSFRPYRKPNCFMNKIYEQKLQPPFIISKTKLTHND